MIAFDASSSGGYNGGSGNLSWSHTCSGSARTLIVGIKGNVWTNGNWIESVTYGGAALTEIHSLHSGFGGNYSHLYIMVAPPTGTHTILIAISNAQPLWAGAASYTGTAQSGQPNAFDFQAGGAGEPMTTDVVTSVADCWTVLFEQGTAGVVDIYGGQRRVYDTATNLWGLYDSGVSVGPAGTHAFTTRRTEFTVSVHILAAIALGGTEIPDDVSTPCNPSCSPGGNTGEEPTSQPLQPWTPECTGGGDVPLAAAPGVAELW